MRVVEAAEVDAMSVAKILGRAEMLAERERLRAAGGRVLSLLFAPGFSTTDLIERIVSRLGRKA